VRYPQVATKLSNDNSIADLEVIAEVTGLALSVFGTIEIEIENIGKCS